MPNQCCHAHRRVDCPCVLLWFLFVGGCGPFLVPKGSCLHSRRSSEDESFLACCIRPLFSLRDAFQFGTASMTLTMHRQAHSKCIVKPTASPHHFIYPWVSFTLTGFRTWTNPCKASVASTCLSSLTTDNDDHQPEASAGVFVVSPLQGFVQVPIPVRPATAHVRHH